MLPSIALALCICLIAGLLALDSRWGHRIGVGGWLALTWILIIGSRPVTLWFIPKSEAFRPETLLDGSPLDRAVYLTIIVLGIGLLGVRGFRWGGAIRSNPWVFLYFAYLAVSAFWSDYPFISLKRCVKDFGNIVVVLLVLSESNPFAIAKVLLLRTTYILVPMSVVLIKYFPELSRYYDTFTGRSFMSGVAVDKNLFGMTLTVLAIGLTWALIDVLLQNRGERKRLQMSVYAMLLIMIAWLLNIADSATAVACATVGIVVLVALTFQSISKNIRTWVALSVFGAAVYMIPGVKTFVNETVTASLGRDASFTGRDEIWEAVLAEPINPLVGVGAYTFWMGDRPERISQGWASAMNEAHNGYIEIYLNVGIVGVVLFLAIPLSTIRRTMRNLANGGGTAEAFRLAFLAVLLSYCITEAVINRLNLLWLGLLLVALIGDQNTGKVREERSAGEHSRLQNRARGANAVIRRRF